MKVAKIVGGGCLGLIVLIGAIIGVVFYATSGITDTADEFFASANDGDYERAYELTSVQMQNQTGLEDLQAFLSGNSLDEVVDTSWASRSIENNRGTLSGTVTTRSGAAIPIEIELVSEGDEWKITLIDVDNVGLMTGGQANLRPDRDPEVDIQADAYSISTGRMLVSHSRLIAAWIDGDYAGFAGIWKDSPAPAELAANFPPDGLSAEELELVEDTRPVIKVARFDADGQLIIGSVIEIPGRTIRTKFIYAKREGSDRHWDIVGLQADLG